MNYEEKYKQALSRATFYNNELPTKEQRKMLLDIFPELQEDNDERIRKELIAHCKNTRCVTEAGAEQVRNWIVWLEKQGESPRTDIEPKKIYADKVIAWLVANICDFEYYIERFKQDFGI